MKLNRARRNEADHYMQQLRQRKDLTGKQRFQLYRRFYSILVEEQEIEDERTVGHLFARMWARRSGSQYPR